MKKLFSLLILTLALGQASAQSKLWQATDAASTDKLEKTDRAAMPTAYFLFSLNLAGLKQTLSTAPMRGSGTTSSLIVEFPNGDGIMEHYRIYEAPVMQAGIAARHPELKSYVGQGIETPSATVRFSTTIFGLHAMVLSPNGTVYIDPYTKNLGNYIVYRKADLLESTNHVCQVGENPVNYSQGHPAEGRSELMNDGKLRAFRLAMACTIEYAAYQITAAGVNTGTTAQKKAAVLAAMNVTMTRVDGVYEREVAVTMQIVDGNEDIIFITSDSFSNTNADSLITQSQTVIDNVIGDDNYDIGHTVSTGGGGLALLGVVCFTGYKAQGITGSDSPVGDGYDIDYVAHEMGHQFGCNHTFNGASGSCSGNTNSGTTVEPGGGTTIMAYAGICGGADIQPHSDDYFHTVSLDEIAAFLPTATCAAITFIDNATPTLSSMSSRTIPYSTAFILKGNTANDANGDALTYCWEQTNVTTTPINVPVATATSGPNYRSRVPVTTPNRYMPVLTSVLANALTPTWEKTPSVGRTLTFALTVRDNNAIGGQTVRKNMSVVVSAAAGPFKVTSQSTTGVIWTNGTQTITWDVAGTDANSINTSQVNIWLSTDGGQNFTTPLATATANDGTETITVPPSITSTTCRIMIEAVGNIYYAVNSKAFTITSLAGTDSFGLSGFTLYPNPNNGTFTVAFTSVSQNNIGVTVHDMRGREVFTKSYANTGIFSGDISLQNVEAGIYMVTVQDGSRKEVRKVVVN